MDVKKKKKIKKFKIFRIILVKGIELKREWRNGIRVY